MRRIGILTFHRSLNYGAFMQMYSLYTRVCKEFPEDRVEIIDYAVRHMQRKYSAKPWEFIFSPISERERKGLKITFKAMVKNAMFCLDKSFLKKRKAMRAAFYQCEKFIEMSEPYICSDDVEEAAEYIRRAGYDLVIVGSDCVWEFNNYPFPNVYYLRDVSDVIKMSYAACAQGVLYQNLSEDEKRYMKESWKQFSYIGVRDAATEELVTSVDGDLEPHHNCDPTIFLNLEQLPVSDMEIRRKMESCGVDFSRPLVCLMANEVTGKLCREVVGDECQIVAVYEQNSYADCFVPNLNPFEWARCFSLFRVVFTNRFHGTILALKSGVSVLTFDGASGNWGLVKNGNSKIKDLYERLGLAEGHYFVGKRSYSIEDVNEIQRWYRYYMQCDERQKMLESIALEMETAIPFFENAKGLLNRR